MMKKISESLNDFDNMKGELPKKESRRETNGAPVSK